MSIEETLAEVVRKVVREELATMNSGAQDLELLTADDVARLLKYPDRHSVYKLKREGKLKPVNLGDKTLRFSHAEVRRFIQECAQ
jgi:predicted DNA-binding transcriptional regulator AlpA